ncbi:hypothetical protein BH23VER1_BH23VER1_25620 [soil metagenome]
MDSSAAQPLLDRLDDPVTWWAAVLVTYLVVGVLLLRHVFADEEEKLARDPYMRLIHLLAVPVLMAPLWPIIALNWWLHFRVHPPAPTPQPGHRATTASRASNGSSPAPEAETKPQAEPSGSFLPSEAKPEPRPSVPEPASRAQGPPGPAASPPAPAKPAIALAIAPAAPVSTRDFAPHAQVAAGIPPFPDQGDDQAG